MAEGGFRYDELVPAEILDLLAGLGREVLALWQSKVMLIAAADQILGARAALFLPDAAAGVPAVEQLRRLLDQRRRARPHQLAAGSAMSLAEGVVWSLLSSADREGGALEPMAGEWLVVIAGHGELQRIADLSEELRFHSTSLRVASCLDGRRGLRRYLFHLRADRQRISSFDGFVAAGGLQDATLLAAFDCGEATLFMPGSLTPARQALQAFRRISVVAPELLGLQQSAAEGGGPLAALLPDAQRPQHLQLLPLGGLDFVDRPMVSPPVQHYLSLEVNRVLSPDEHGLDSLRAAIAGSAARHGYRLELRRTARGESSSQSLRRLREQLDELQYRLAYETSLHGAHPVLLRFPASDPEALVDAISRFPSETLRDGTLEYGFQASMVAGTTGEGAAAWHFLLYHREQTVMDGPYPPWTHPGATRFWLDPVWAEHNLRRQHQGALPPLSLLFVPQHTTLFPTPHAWDPGNVDNDLRETVSGWFPQWQELIRSLKQPLYVFAPAGDDPDTLCLHLLDRADLQPLRERIGWLNDHLVLQRSIGGVEQLISGLAAKVTAAELAARLTPECQGSVAEFETAARRANDAIAAGAGILLDLMTAEITETARRCEEAAQTISRLHGVLAAAELAAGDARQQLGEAERFAAESLGEAGTLLQSLQELTSRLEQAVAGRAQLAGRCSAEIATLRATEQRLREDLKQVRRGAGSRGKR